ncbi:hypothetical protein CGLO_00238 [Colletotrichum gloeosporioides Cg-14]
MDKVI